MTAFELLVSDSTYGYEQLRLSLENCSEGQAWAQLPNLGPDYLHTDATIHGIILHIAGAKKMYGSICFRNTEHRWREIAEEIEAFEPSWEAALTYLNHCHNYWMESWQRLEDVETLVSTNWNKEMPAWKVIRLMSQHDSYHAGQIVVLRYGVAESSKPPPSSAEDIRTYCKDSAAW